MNYSLNENAEISGDGVGVERTQVKLPLLSFLPEIAASIGVIEGEFSLNMNHVDTDCLVDVVYHGVFDWCSIYEKEAQHRRLLVFITDLPLRIQVGMEGRMRESRIDAADTAGQLRAVIVNHKEELRVMPHEGDDASAMQHYPSVVMLDLPFKNNFLNKA